MTPDQFHRLSVAPMMDWTDRHCRFFLRQITRRALLYTEMVTTGAILHGDRERFLAYDESEHPLALQLGGSDPAALAECARIAEAFGYDEVNLNVGCPSDRVRTGRFGACLMAEPALVGSSVAAMRAATALPVTVKCRIGIDERDGYEDLLAFVDEVAAIGGCGSFAVHARKAWLQGLSPKQNREVPPLRHAEVHRLKRERPDLEIVINGGILSVEAALAHLESVDGAMIGRAAYQDPWCLAEADRRVFGETAPAPGRAEVVARLLPYLEAECARGTPLKSMTRHILGLFNGLPGARAWRRHLSEAAHRPGAGPEVVEQALEQLDRRGALLAA
ncbi:MAG: tRNA dihydrouridine(20/20a) synthase DusA [Tistlia sp.]|uniref:tRNA dihydrouridine(20/20a) synthase DusA n=1 Tax=Tistlia sp. TaxID=3057121 RepID=UPI0034A2BE08